MAWLSGYNYRKSITLSRASGAVTLYQMKLLLGESSGATGEDVDCGGKCLSNFNDIRFTASDGTTLLDYWIESITGATPNQLATIWIEFDSIGTGATTFYMYYGKADAAAYSNGTNTFIVFDNFERGNDGDAVGGDWTVGAGAVTISTEQDIGNVAGFSGTRGMKVAGNAAQSNASIPRTHGDGTYAIRGRVYKENASQAYLFHGDGTKLIQLLFQTDEKIYYYTTGYVDSGGTITADAWGLIELRNINFSAGTFDIYWNDSLVKSGAGMRANASYPDVARVAGHTTTNYDSWWDDFIIRNWRATEPAWGAWGAEEPLSITLAVDDLSHADSLGALALIQIHNLVVANLLHADSIGVVSISQIHQLIVAALSHGHSMGSVTLSQVHQLTVQALNHAHTIGGVTLSLEDLILVVQDLTHAFSVDSIGIMPRHVLLVVQDLSHVNTIGSVSLLGFFTESGRFYSFPQDLISDIHPSSDVTRSSVIEFIKNMLADSGLKQLTVSDDEELSFRQDKI